MNNAVELLLVAGDSARRLDCLFETLRSANHDSAYAIERRVAARLGPIGGWKVGAAEVGFVP